MIIINMLCYVIDSIFKYVCTWCQVCERDAIRRTTEMTIRLLRLWSRAASAPTTQILLDAVT